MQCSNCGHERPRSGNCPHCGASATNAPSSSHPSSLRGWRDDGQSPGNSRLSRPTWDDDAPPPRAPNSRPTSSRGSGTGWGGADESYNAGYGRGNDSFARRPGDSMPRRPGDSMPRRPGDSMVRRSNDSYGRRDDFDDGYNDRALMPSAMGGGAVMPQLDDHSLPALPSEEEERALGIRRPAYIPATDTRKGERPSRMRVISGTASIMLLCVALLGVSGFLVKQNVLPGFLRLAGVSSPDNASTPGNAIPTQFASLKPVVTVVSGSPITTVSSYASETDSSIPGAPVTPGKPSDIFITGRYVYIIGNTNDGVKKGDVIAVKWYSNDNDITDSIKGASKTANCCSFTIGAQQAGVSNQLLFRVTYPVATRGKAEIYYNSKIAATVLFLVVDQSQFPTPTVPTTPTPSGTPAPSATKHP